MSYGPIGSADITIYFAELPEGILGVASVDVDPWTKVIRSATIVLTTLLTTDWYTLEDEDYKNIAAHELGHTIGLGHGGPPGTLMHSEADLTADAYTPLWPTSLIALELTYTDRPLHLLRPDLPRPQ